MAYGLFDAVAEDQIEFFEGKVVGLGKDAIPAPQPSTPIHIFA
jgi:hypothetical protein